jgi:hypothetical protein
MKKHLKKIKLLSQIISERKPQMMVEDTTSETLPKQNQGSQFNIEKGFPAPLKRVRYDLQLELAATIGKLEIGDSFIIKEELKYPVQRMKERLYPEYKLRFRLTGDDFRVFRVA